MKLPQELRKTISIYTYVSKFNLWYFFGIYILQMLNALRLYEGDYDYFIILIVKLMKFDDLLVTNTVHQKS